VDGVLAIDKPAGMTSHDVVDRVRKELRTRRVGHGGTLDPDATGVLVVGVGKATRFLSFAQQSPKRYEGTIRLGTVTSTQDASGDVIETNDVAVTEDQIRSELKRFVGPIEQVPPMVSAVRVGGERLHEKARRGEEVEREPRKVTIYELEPTSIDLSEGEVRVDVLCSAGTYIRTLAHDVGAALGCGAHLSSLRRTAAGGFKIESCIDLDDVSPDRLLPIASVVGHLRQIEVNDEGAGLVKDGRPLPSRDEMADGTSVAVVRDGELLAVYESKGGRLKADRVVPR
jgi:tRNA pseudouridine55 synthase